MSGDTRTFGCCLASRSGASSAEVGRIRGSSGPGELGRWDRFGEQVVLDRDGTFGDVAEGRDRSSLGVAVSLELSGELGFRCYTSRVRHDAEFEVPPASLCAWCGSAVCDDDACKIETVQAARATIAWEAPGPLLARLWSTARASATAPELVFGKLRDGPVLGPCAFALSVECVALGSLAVVGLGLTWLLVPDLAMDLAATVASQAPLTGLVIGSVPMLALLMVGLHALWGVALELGARLAGADWRPARGLRFAFYSCGWDLLTSPAGLVFGFVSGGASQAWRETLCAARVPRAAMDAYLIDSRELSPAHSLRARRLVILFMGVPVLAGVVLLAWLVVETIWRLS